MLLLESVLKAGEANRHDHPGQDEHEHHLDKAEAFATHETSVGCLTYTFHAYA